MSVDRSRNLEIILHMSVAHFEKKKKKIADQELPKGKSV